MTDLQSNIQSKITSCLKPSQWTLPFVLGRTLSSFFKQLRNMGVFQRRGVMRGNCVVLQPWVRCSERPKIPPRFSQRWKRGTSRSEFNLGVNLYAMFGAATSRSSRQRKTDATRETASLEDDTHVVLFCFCPALSVLPLEITRHKVSQSKG